ncbi:MAG: UPF0716 protein FxsA [Candidatus Latescibacterota bacterium]|jgi:UPF0716 protein FxsA|tara:strand:- start:250 stop:651 length:402 start_codon:yes stop_codon:yes gene_type:complete
MFLRLLLLFTIVPIVELALLIEVGRQIGSLPTVALVLVTGAAGAALARSQGLLAFQRLRQGFGQGQSPGDALLDGVLVLVGGLLLLTPGILTDLVGFGVLLPSTRKLIRRYLREAIARRLQPNTIHTTNFTVS